jgi:hypothetical protein
MPDELIYEYKGKVTSATIKEITQAGVKVTYNLAGEVKGKYHAARLETVDAILHPDRTGEFENRFLDQTMEGETITGTAKGKSSAVNPTTIRVEGSGMFMTGSKKYAWLNGTAGRFEGSLNPLTGEVSVNVFSSK